MEKRENISFLTPLSSFVLNNARLDTGTDNKDDQSFSLSSPSTKPPSWVIDFDTLSIGERKADVPLPRPFTESSVVQRPQWYEELLTRRKSEDFSPSVSTTAASNERVTSTPIPPESPDIISILDDNFDRKKEVKSGRRASTFLTTPEAVESQEHIPQFRSKEKISYLSPDCASEKDEDLLLRIKSSNRKNSIASKDLVVSDFEDDDVSEFIIPELPEGQLMVIDVKSNWGDEDYVGLNGIEIFEANTKNIAKVEKIWCEPQSDADVNTLIDGCYRTQDNSHIWLSSYNQSSNMRIKIKFEERTTVLLIRIWNYNKSRIYSFRGVRFILITLDEKIIFKGEIAKAHGELNGPIEKFGDTILFTTDEDILESLAKNDTFFQQLLTDPT